MWNEHVSVSKSKSYLFMGIDYKKTNQIRGRNDVNIIFNEKLNEGYKIIGGVDSNVLNGQLEYLQSHDKTEINIKGLTK